MHNMHELLIIIQSGLRTRVIYIEYFDIPDDALVLYVRGGNGGGSKESFPIID